MVKSISYTSGDLLKEIDCLKLKLDSYFDGKIFRVHNQRRAALEHESLNTSLYIEYPEMEQIIPGRMDREAKKLLQRLNTAWVYCKDNVSKEIGISIRDLEVIQGIIVSEGELGVRIADVVFDIPHEIPAPKYTLVPKLMEELFTNLQELKDKIHPVEHAAYMHLHLLYIHPFMDGNGRTTRHAQNFELEVAGYVPAIIQPHERWLYFSLLDAAKKGILDDQTSPQRPFYDFIATKVQEGLEKVLTEK